MSLISRLTTWTTQILTSSSLNNEFSNITNLLNNLDGATTTWTNVKTAGLTTTGTTVLTGTTTNDSAATGKVGEYQGATGSAVSAAATTVFVNITSVSLTAGDWDVCGVFEAFDNGGTISSTSMQVAISAFSGNTLTDHAEGDNYVNALPPKTVGAKAAAAIPCWRVSIASTTTIYLKGALTYSAGAPQWWGRISARRAR